MKNRRNIIESELPPQNSLDIWMKDGKFYRSTNKGWVLIEDQMEFTNSELMSKSTATSGTIGVNKETGEASIYNDVTKEWNPLGGGGGGMTEITWQELKTKRDSGELNPGSLYRITDYVNTTNVTFDGLTSHLFDIILLALTSNTLAEEGWAAMHQNVYDVTFTIDNVIKKCYIYRTEGSYANIVDINTLIGISECVIDDELIINEEDHTATVNYESSVLNEENLPYNDFQDTNFGEWKIWYSLDNNTARFSWADDSMNGASPAKIGMSNGGDNQRWTRDTSGDTVKNSVQYYMWHSVGSGDYYTTSETPNVGDALWKIIGGSLISTSFTVTVYEPAVIGTPNGRGVIYRLIDEWNNDCPYDFKNVLYLRNIKYEDGFIFDNGGTDEYLPTFCLLDGEDSMYKDASVLAINYADDEGYYRPCISNSITNLEGAISSLNSLLALPNCIIIRWVEDNDAAWSGNHNSLINCNSCNVIDLNNAYIINGYNKTYNNNQNVIIWNNLQAVFENIT